MTTNTEIYFIVTDHILSRLPVQSLLRFKCVCKNWNELINTSSFIEKHFNSESNRLRLMITKFGLNYHKNPCVRPFDTYLLPDKIFSGCVPTHKLIYHGEDVGDIRGIYGPIDGLFLLEKGHYIDNGRFGWWNPATKECRLIPRVFFEVEDGLEDNDRRIGIGIDLATHDYKIIWVRTYWNDNESDIFPKVYAAVYSTKNDSWKHLEPNFSHECQICMSSQHCTYKNGPPIPGEHWVTLFLRGGSIATMSSKDVTQAMTAFYDIWYDKFIYELTPSCKVLFYDQTTKQVTSLGFEFDGIGFGSCWVLSYKESLVPIRKEKPSEKDNIEYFMVDY
ncbi:hypothetical protein KY290_028217 [Solanum tuberosum]|uniref:F-box domain-containing protein n=1 Tax=Solanum tuberosum TaxID=4113 RepID=A0ABQ7UH85_SOLTU|nr:hypothetical protein KY284_027181 [Solanum tuberosum]KAH0748985.1 hypothetical protein KY290_028217 [Solanum tuberosum]